MPGRYDKLFMFRIHSSSSRKLALQLYEFLGRSFFYHLIVDFLSDCPSEYQHHRRFMETLTKKVNRRKKKKSGPRPPMTLPRGRNNMKRTANSIENDPPEIAATTATETTQHNTAKRKDAGARKESPNIKTDRYAMKDIKGAREPLEIVFHPRPPAPFKIGYDGTIRPSSPQEIIRYEGVAAVAPLKDDAIIAMLKEFHPNDPAAQSYVRTHEAKKAGRRFLEAKIADRENLRKQVARKMRDRARQVANLDNASKQIGPSLAPLPKEDEKQDDGKKDELVSMREQLERVSQAHERLQKAIEAFQIK
ncbi:uncharacterized protein KD926_000315 [Aspergillus affinis]|uniref:uncharacterized protein n=1 Tax=Aspergillus affinis TaxID=1070780 RepID=UPI0022FE7615|nr:uncharacterized protein KD926_000315 [Aspergillus affinis]KAI9037436.1 hypothetical protein KD926_000315 [Aspergillus affinis]